MNNIKIAEVETRISTITSLATEALGSREKATRWLNKHNRALEGDTPLSRLDTPIGFQQVKGVLFQIEHGIFT